MIFASAVFSAGGVTQRVRSMLLDIEEPVGRVWMQMEACHYQQQRGGMELIFYYCYGCVRVVWACRAHLLLCIWLPCLPPSLSSKWSTLQGPDSLLRYQFSINARERIDVRAHGQTSVRGEEGVYGVKWKSSENKAMSDDGGAARVRRKSESGGFSLPSIIHQARAIYLSLID